MLRTLPLVTLLLAVSAGCGSATETKTTTAVKAEKSVKTVTSKPAVDTSQLQAAPTWALVDLAGKPVTSESFKGKVVIVDFWATWCGPCRAAIPHLIELQKVYKDKGFEVVGVSLDQQGPAVVQSFVDKNSIQYTIAMGNQKIVSDFGGVRGIPTAFIISQDGKIFRKIVRPGAPRAV